MKDVEIVEPVDFERLALAYQKENYNWYGKYGYIKATAKDLEEFFLELKQTATGTPQYPYASSGGLKILNDGRIFLQHRIARHYSE